MLWSPPPYIPKLDHRSAYKARAKYTKQIARGAAPRGGLEGRIGGWEVYRGGERGEGGRGWGGDYRLAVIVGDRGEEGRKGRAGGEG